MANAAQFLASPLRRILAGVVDLVVLQFLIGLSIVVADEWRPTAHVAIALFVYGFYHAVTLSIFRGATPALRAFDMRIVSTRDGAELSLVQVFIRSALRPVLVHAFGWVAFTFGREPGFIFAVVLAPMLLEMGMMFTLPTRQTLSDLVSRTLVINVPPPQPHRAPAAPMYSATDAEFGVRPHRK